MPIHFTTVHFRGVQLAKNDFGLVFIFCFAQKLHFPVPFRFYKIDCGFVFLVHFLHSIFHLCLCGMKLEMMCTSMLNWSN